MNKYNTGNDPKMQKQTGESSFLKKAGNEIKIL